MDRGAKAILLVVSFICLVPTVSAQELIKATDDILTHTKNERQTNISVVLSVSKRLQKVDEISTGYFMGNKFGFNITLANDLTGQTISNNLDTIIFNITSEHPLSEYRNGIRFYDRTVNHDRGYTEYYVYYDFEDILNKFGVSPSVDIDYNTALIKFDVSSIKFSMGSVIDLDPIIYEVNISSNVFNDDVLTESYGYSHLNTSDDGPYVYYSFDIEDSGTVVYDLSDNNLDGTLYTGTDLSTFQNSSGHYSGMFECYDGTGSSIGHSTTGWIGDGFTIMFWYWSDDTFYGGINEMTFGTHDWDDDSIRIKKDPWDGITVYVENDADVESNVDTEDNPSNLQWQGAWSHITIIINVTGTATDQPVARVYHNGSEMTYEDVAYQDGFGTWDPTTRPTMGICDYEADDAGTAGKVDDYMVFDRILTDSEILDIYNEQMGRYKSSGTQDIEIGPFKTIASSVLTNPLYAATGIVWNNSYFYITGLDGSNVDSVFQYHENFTHVSTTNIEVSTDLIFDLHYYDDKWYMVDNADDDIAEYYDNFTATGTEYSTSAYETSPRGIFRHDGSWWMVGTAGDDVNELDDAWSHQNTYDTLPYGNPFDLVFYEGFWYVIYQDQISQHWPNWTYTGRDWNITIGDASRSWGFTGNGSYFWIIEYDDELVYHTYPPLSGYNSINVSLEYHYSDLTNISLSVADQDGSTETYNMTNNTVQNFTINNHTTELNLSLTFYSDSNSFYSPILSDFIDITAWYFEPAPAPAGAVNNRTVTDSMSYGEATSINVTEAAPSDTTPPYIAFVPDTNDNATSTTETNVSINISIVETEPGSIVFNWDGTNTTVFNDSSLVMAFNFDNVSSLGENEALVKDLTGRYDGVVINATYIAGNGKYEGSYDFQGVIGDAHYIDAGNLTDVGINDDPFTVMAWVKVSCLACGSGNGDFVNRWKNNTDGYKCFSLYSTQLTTENFVFDVLNETGQAGEAITDNFFITANQWYHLVGVYNTTHVMLYVDGVLEDTDEYSGGGCTNDDASLVNVTVGAAPEISADGLNGTIDDVYIWNRSLSASEIEQWYHMSLKKYDDDDFTLYVNQTLNATDGLDAGNYTYIAFASDTTGNWNSTEERHIEITEVIANIFNRTLADSMSYDEAVSINRTWSQEELDRYGVDSATYGEAVSINRTWVQDTLDRYGVDSLTYDEAVSIATVAVADVYNRTVIDSMSYGEAVARAVQIVADLYNRTVMDSISYSEAISTNRTWEQDLIDRYGIDSMLYNEVVSRAVQIVADLYSRYATDSMTAGDASTSRIYFITTVSDSMSYDESLAINKYLNFYATESMNYGEYVIRSVPVSRLAIDSMQYGESAYGNFTGIYVPPVLFPFSSICFVIDKEEMVIVCMDQLQWSPV